METLVVVPTYNERENIARLVDALLALPLDLHILVVDDNSPDGTGTFVDEWARREPRLHVLHRPEKAGLGGAYIAGFTWALAHTDARYIFEMDADFSHNPSAIPEFLARIPDFDLVIGSRYARGVTVVNWPLSRLILSVSANIYTRIITGLPLHDATGGFKCFRREVLAALPLQDVRSDGYSFQIEMNFHVWKRGYRMVEIPIVFTDRLVGTSKMSRRIVWEAAFMVWKLRFASIFRRIP
ncbi:MAG: polyprenol monophosphomannose synthase [Candidatus Krumholzibacteria bacterium]|nr:polyprenol monophosphomannose synthase [Candidatus Krumholzibacteria bacterium]MDH4336689.1 polyprenol monophosphomannose synthase [Candidatus Krumholzibacteria bacterium]MDH5270810.1 polyprenol monophosphomannose synthase [Candidatus Krumholzibacteria bacterium]MDH5627153.1 polyprenol monophosphomannose synthase [Candidatus Krumholzibacteria bacterium]